MRRRAILALLSLALSYSLIGVVHAQPAKKAWRIGYLSGQFGQTELSRSVVRGLRELGYTEGQNLVVEYRLAMGRNERLNELAEDLVRGGLRCVRCASSG